MTVINARHRFNATPCHGKLTEVSNHSDRPAIPKGVPRELADDVLGLPVEILRWVSLVGPRLTEMTEQEQADALIAMAEVAEGGGKRVNIFLGNKNINVEHAKVVNIKHA